MKKAKIISLVVIMLSVIVLGVFMGKQMFKLMEAGSSQSGSAASSAADAASSSVKILYSADSSGVAATNNTTAITPQTSTFLSTTTAQIGNEAVKPNKGKEPEFDASGPKWYAYASGNGTNVRPGPSTDVKYLFKVSKGTRGVVVDKKNGWTSIKWDFNRKTGWVRDDLLLQGPAEVMHALVSNSEDLEKIDANKISKATAKEILRENKVAVAIAQPASITETVLTYVKGKNLPEQARIEATTFANIRSGPSTNSDKVAKLPKGTIVKINNVRQEGRYQWFEITFNDGKKTGWTREDNLKF